MFKILLMSRWENLNHIAERSPAINIIRLKNAYKTCTQSSIWGIWKWDCKKAMDNYYSKKVTELQTPFLMQIERSVAICDAHDVIISVHQRVAWPLLPHQERPWPVLLCGVQRHLVCGARRDPQPELVRWAETLCDVTMQYGHMQVEELPAFRSTCPKPPAMPAP